MPKANQTQPVPDAVWRRAATIRLDALVARHLHGRRLAPLTRRIRLVDFLAIVVPVLYLPVRLVSKGSGWYPAVEVAWEALAAILLALAVAKVALGWSERAALHSQLLDRDADVARYAASVLAGNGRMSLETVEELALEVDKADLKALGRLTAEDRQDAYRAALLELDPGGAPTSCPACGASPLRFRKGDCQACGNTPETKP